MRNEFNKKLKINSRIIVQKTNKNHIFEIV